VLSRRRLSNLLGALTVAALLSACGSAAPTANQAVSSSGSQLLEQALTDAREAGSVHEVMTNRLKGGTVVMADDIGTTEGRQLISVTPGEAGRVLVFGASAYIAGDQTALTHFFGFPAATARQIGDRWVSMPASNREYTAVADDATLSSALTDLGLGGHLTELVPSTVDGQPVVGIIGAAEHLGGSDAPLGTVYVSRSNHPLPVEVTYSLSDGEHTTLRFDDWGERLTLRRPHRVIGAAALDRLLKSATRTTAKSPLDGYWVATGHVLKTHDSAVQVPGEVIQRLWLIRQVCSNAGCTLAFTRQTAGATADTLGTPITAPLKSTGSGWLSTFSETDVRCQGISADYPGTEISHWSMTYTSSTITALEQTRTTGPNCETGTTTIRWTAVRRPSKTVPS
jgi:hypothetical protein